MNILCKLVESRKYLVGDAQSQWYIYIALYQQGRRFRYVIFDTTETSEMIQTHWVTPYTANILDGVLVEALAQRPDKWESLDDFYKILQATFYATFFHTEPMAV